MPSPVSDERLIERSVKIERSVNTVYHGPG